jgi:peptidyl-tRNA hydrolase
MHVQARRGHPPKSYKPSEPAKPKLYLVTRRDLEPAQQAVQAAHALRQFTHEQPEADKAWFEESNVLALLAVDTERKLRGLLDVAQFMGVPCAAFHEPDMGGCLTAVALGPCTESRRLTRRLGPAMG